CRCERVDVFERLTIRVLGRNAQEHRSRSAWSRVGCRRIRKRNVLEHRFPERQLTDNLYWLFNERRSDFQRCRLGGFTGRRCDGPFWGIANVKQYWTE